MNLIVKFANLAGKSYSKEQLTTDFKFYPNVVEIYTFTDIE